jgi:hypothetical protein
MALLGEKVSVPGVGAALVRVPEGRDQTGHSLACGIPFTSQSPRRVIVAYDCR